MALSMVESTYDVSLAEKDELFRELTAVVTHWINRHNTRLSVAGKHISRDFTEIKDRLDMSEEEFSYYMREIAVWIKIHGSNLIP